MGYICDEIFSIIYDFIMVFKIKCKPRNYKRYGTFTDKKRFSAFKLFGTDFSESVSLFRSIKMLTIDIVFPSAVFINIGNAFYGKGRFKIIVIFQINTHGKQIMPTYKIFYNFLCVKRIKTGLRLIYKILII